jgi:hypothetical protein
MRRISGRGLSSGTSPERIAPESLTPLHSGFVHRNISRWRRISALDQVWHGSTREGMATKSLKCAGPRSRIRRRKESTGFMASAIPGGTKRRSSERDCSLPLAGEGRRRAAAHCVLATRGGVAWVMNWVASSMAVPSGVGTAIRNGTRMRVPATGAKATSMLRCAVRYLMTARSGM